MLRIGIAYSAHLLHQSPIALQRRVFSLFARPTAVYMLKNSKVVGNRKTFEGAAVGESSLHHPTIQDYARVLDRIAVTQRPVLEGIVAELGEERKRLEDLCQQFDRSLERMLAAREALYDLLLNYKCSCCPPTPSPCPETSDGDAQKPR